MAFVVGTISLSKLWIKIIVKIIVVKIVYLLKSKKMYISMRHDGVDDYQQNYDKIENAVLRTYLLYIPLLLYLEVHDLAMALLLHLPES